MMNRKLKKIAVVSLVIIAITMLSVGALAIASNKSPSNVILDLFKQKQSDNPLVLNDFKNLDTFAFVNGVPIPKNVIILKKALYEAVAEHSKNGGEPLSGALAIDSCPSEEEIVREIAKRLLFVEYAKEQGIIVVEADVVACFAEMDEHHQQRLRGNNPEAILKEQSDKEFLTVTGLSEEEFKEYMLKEQIVYSLYCEKYAKAQTNKLDFQSPTLQEESNNLASIDSICNDLLTKAEIVYCK